MNMKKVTKRVPWTDAHVKQLLALYFEFLTLEQENIKYTKAGPVRALAEKQGRSKGSIEAKMMNVSAVLQKLNKPWVNGYKPLSNFNKELENQVSEFINQQ